MTKLGSYDAKNTSYFHLSMFTVVKPFLTNSKVFGDGEELKKGPQTGDDDKISMRPPYEHAPLLMKKHNREKEGKLVIYKEHQQRALEDWKSMARRKENPSFYWW